MGNIETIVGTKIPDFKSADKFSEVPPSFIKTNSMSSGPEIIYMIPQLAHINERISYGKFGIDLDDYEMRLFEIISNSDSQRECVTNLAIFMASEFPQLPYRLANSCGHDGTDLTGLSWLNDIVSYGEYYDGEIGHRTLDCSGFVNWCFVNSGLPVPGKNGIVSDYVWTYAVNYDGYVTADNLERLNSESIHTTRPGDLMLIRNSDVFDHIGVVVAVNETSHEITVVHISGSGNGTNITTMNVDTLTISQDQVGPGVNNRIGDYYFNYVLHMTYEDEAS